MDFVLIMTGVGVISLAGVVVNNAIVLIDYIELTRKRKREEQGFESKGALHEDEVRESIVHAGKTRLRPVLLTAITTILGLIPLAIGLNINFTTLITDFDPQVFIGGDNVAFWGPMSWTVIYGLTFATFLTLVIVPVMYWLADRMTVGFSNFYAKYSTRKEATPAEPVTIDED
jgi:multidrug efflux pump subunit AcrB